MRLREGKYKSNLIYSSEIGYHQMSQEELKKKDRVTLLNQIQTNKATF